MLKEVFICRFGGDEEGIELDKVMIHRLEKCDSQVDRTEQKKVKESRSELEVLLLHLSKMNTLVHDNNSKKHFRNDNTVNNNWDTLDKIYLFTTPESLNQSSNQTPQESQS